MALLPPHHLARRRLISAAKDVAVLVVEAGAGYGKTTLAAAIVEDRRAVEVEVTLHEGVAAESFTARLEAGLRRAGLSYAAAAMADAGYDPPGAVDAAIDALAGESCVIVIDDVQHADRGAAVLIERMARRVALPLRLIILGRRLPPGCERLRRAEFAGLRSADLGLRVEETLELCKTGFGLDVDRVSASALHSVTGGWTAATVLAASRVRRTGESLTAVVAAAEAGDGRSAVVAILDEAVGALDTADIQTLSQVARVFDLDRAAIDVLADEDGFLDRVMSAGIPFVAVGSDRYTLPGPVRDFFTAAADADPSALRRLADRFIARSDLGSAVRLLMVSHDLEGAAALLGVPSPALLDTIDLLEYQSVVDGLGPHLLHRHPRILLHLARLQDGAALFAKRAETLDRLDAVLDGRQDLHAISAALSVERTVDRIRDGAFADVESQASELLTDDAIDEVTRARALSALARAVCWRTDSSGARDIAAIRRSDTYFAQAADLYRAAGMHTAAAAMVPYQAMWVDYALGNAKAALTRIDLGLEEVVARPRKWAYLLSFRCEVLVELGRYDEAAAANEQSIEVGERYGDDQLRAFGYWNRAIIASHLGDAERVLGQVRLVERHPGEWFGPVSGDFLGAVADDLDRVGHTSLAWEYLERAKADPRDGEAVIAMSEAALLARHGDPERAEVCLDAVFTHRVDPREAWRVTLFRAYATFRRGEPGAGALASRAFEQAARMGLGPLPFTKEREVTSELLGLAAETGQPAALALRQATLPMMLRVLGRFALTCGGRPIEVSPGQGAELLKLLAVSGRSVVTERAIDALWPDADQATGRNRLRTVLNRLRSDAGDVVGRVGERLMLHPDLRVDLDLFETEGHRALALGRHEPALAVAVARAAMAYYNGDVLPEDGYSSWADQPRAHARRMALDLLDLCADVAAARGDLDEVRRLVERTIDLAPYDDVRYLRAASTMLEQGRRGAALAVLTRARAALNELGAPPSLDLIRIEQMIVA